MNENLLISKKDEMVMKIIHYFITEENYKPVIIRGIDNEIWLENFDAEYKLIRVNVNYIHNNTQFKTDLYKANSIRKSIKRKTYSLKMNVLNILIDYGEDVEATSSKEIASVKVGNNHDIKESTELTSMFPKLSESLKMKKNEVVDFFKLTEDMNEKNKEEEKTYKKWNKKLSKYSATNILIAINILMFIGTYILGAGSEDSATLLIFGANYSELVKIGQVWRLITCAFIHIGIFHLFFNMLALRQVGEEVEKFYGSKKFLIIYFISALIGSLASCVFNPGYISAGASGAIFGLFGALLYFGTQYRATLDGILKSPIMSVILINLLIGFAIPGIDVISHIGGLIGGFMMSKALGVDGKNKKAERMNCLIFVILLTLFLGIMVFV